VTDFFRFCGSIVTSFPFPLLGKKGDNALLYSYYYVMLFENILRQAKNNIDEIKQLSTMVIQQMFKSYEIGQHIHTETIG